MRCAVCGSPNASEWHALSGDRVGMACANDCFPLLWEAYLLRNAGGMEWEHDEVLWRWQRRRAQVEVRPFHAPRPESPAELAALASIETLGLADIARELE